MTERLSNERLAELEDAALAAKSEPGMVVHVRGRTNALLRLAELTNAEAVLALVDEVRERRAADPAPIDWASLPRECRVCSGKIGLDEAAVYGRRGPVHQACEALL